MKILIFSDSHGDVETMVQVIEKENPETIVHLGDDKADLWGVEHKWDRGFRVEV